MTADDLKRAVRWLVAGILVGMPTVFWRSTVDAFDLPKATLLVIAVVSGLPLGVFLLRLGGRGTVPRRAWASALLLWAAMLFATFTSIDPATSTIGQVGRYTGLVVMTALLMLMLMVAAVSTERNAESLVGWIAAGSASVAIYSFVQVAGIDPYTWGSVSFVSPVLSTLGNPNMSSAYLAVAAPCVAHLMIRPESSRSMRLFSGALLGAVLASLGPLESMQGQVVILLSAVAVCAETWFLKPRRGEWVTAASISTLVLLGPQVPSSTASFLLIVLIGACTGWYVPQLNRMRIQRSRFPSRRTLLVASAVAAVAGALLIAFPLRERMSAGLRDSFVERGDFYRVALAIFRDNPLSGSGLQTFGLRFTELRPASHAMSLEDSVSNSAHSLPLAMFADGGLVLGLAYFVFAGLVAWTIVHVLRRSPRGEAPLMVPFAAAWAGFQLQALVSVENVALFTLHFILAGVIFALAKPQTVEPSTIGANKGKATPQRRVNTVLVALCTGVAFLGAVVVATRPIRAAWESQQATEAVNERGDVEEGLERLTKAVDLAPWEPTYRLQRSEVLSQNDALREAVDDAMKAARMNPYNTRLLRAVAVVLFRCGEDDEALRQLEQALIRDPHAPKLRSEVAQSYAASAERAAASGDTATARRRFERALELEPDLEAALAGLARLSSP
jgi:Tfp pilus assembly protein PilF